MSGSNGYAALVKQRSGGGTKRRLRDDYETPESVTRRLCEHVKIRGPILEPACGSGYMMGELRAQGFKVTGTDIKNGADFLKRSKPWAGSIVTNPPYRDGLAERFIRHALKLADEQVCMLIQSGFIWGDKRGAGLFEETKPNYIIVIPERIYFLVNGKPIPSQFFSHAWLCWPSRKVREGRQQPSTQTIWASNLGYSLADNFG